MRFAVMAVDPGRATGVARGLFWADTTIEQGLRPPGERVDRAYGDLDDGFRIWLVIESFALRQVNVDLTGVEVAAGFKALLVPRDAGLDGRLSLPFRGGKDALYAMGATVSEQTPADAKGWATDRRLKEWGLWPVAHAKRKGRALGKGDHRTDAVRHMALKVARILHADDGWPSRHGGGADGYVGEVLRTYAGGPGMESWVVEGDPRIQAWELAAEFREWVTDLRAPAGPRSATRLRGSGGVGIGPESGK